MTATVVNMVTYSDADYILEDQQSPVRVVGNPLHMHVRTAADDKTVWLDVSSANGMITSEDAGTYDTVSILIPQAKLLTLPPGEYVQSLIMSSDDATHRTEVWRGTLTHSAGPTRWTAGEP